MQLVIQNAVSHRSCSFVTSGQTSFTKVCQPNIDMRFQLLINPEDTRVRKYKYKREHVPLKFFKYRLSRTPPHSIAIKNHEEIYGSMFSMLVCINKFKKGAFFGKLAILSPGLKYALLPL